MDETLESMFSLFPLILVKIANLCQERIDLLSTVYQRVSLLQILTRQFN